MNESIAKLARALKDRGWFDFPKARLLCLLLALALSVPGLGLGLFMDDYIHVAMLQGEEYFAKPYDLFRFAGGNAGAMQAYMDRGPFPWWTLPELHAAFCRPLSSVLKWFDYAVFGDDYAWWHLHSIVWHLLLILAAGLVLERTVGGGAGALALIVFTLDESHWTPVAWLASRNALVAAVPALFGFLAHMRWREDGWRPGLPLSLLGYAVGLAGCEAALGILAYVVAYELFAREDTLPRRTAALVPAGCLVAVYLALYRALGYGAYGSAGYTDPIGEPFVYLVGAPARLLTFVGAQLLSFPADAWLSSVAVRPFLAAVGAIAVLICAGIMRACWSGFGERERRAMAWMIPGALLGLLPCAAAHPTHRSLLPASLAGSVVAAAILRNWWLSRSRGAARINWRARTYAAACWYLAFTNLVLAPISWPVQSWGIGRFGKGVSETMNAAEIDDAKVAGQRVVLLVAPEPITFLYPPVIRFVEGRPLPASWHVLSLAPHEHRLTRTHANRIELEVLGGAMMESEFEQVLRSPEHPFEVGQRIVLKGLAVTVLEVADAGPAKVAFEFDCPLEDPSLHFMVWRDHALRTVRLPRLGESMTLARELGMLHPKVVLDALL